MEKKKKKIKVSDVIILLMTLLLAAAFFITLGKMALSFFEKDDRETKENKKTEAEQLIDQNLDIEYPLTSREVVKTYCKIVKNMYYGDCTEKQIEALFLQLRKLFDEELLAVNTSRESFDKLQQEISDYSQKKVKVINYILQQNQDIRSYTFENREHALVQVTFKLKEDANWYGVNEEFVMRKDDDERWKIMGWHQIDKAVEGNEE